MVGSHRNGVVRALAVAVAATTLAVGAGMVTGVGHVAAEVIPSKVCTGSGPGGVAEPGDTLSCVVSAGGVLLSGDTISVQPATPSGAAIEHNGCVGVTSAGTAPFTYSTTVTESGGMCTWTVTATTFGAVGNSVIGTESLKIPSSTPAGTSVTQQADQCGPSVAGAPPLCSPFLPLPTSGAGSCVGGAALPVIGGCAPSLPGPTPTPAPSASASPTASGGGGGGGGSSNGPSPGGVQAASTSTPFTSGPAHPLPVAAALVVAGGVLVALLAAFGPTLVRRRRHLP